ncbi:hypothetical protein DM02DRAFT_546403, partial [Periconia macrospinosa]
VSSVLPAFTNNDDPIISQQVTIQDLLSHRSGLSSLDAIIQGLDGEITIEPDEVVGFANAMPAIADFRTK